MTDQTPAPVEPPIAPATNAGVPPAGLPPSPTRTGAPAWVLPLVTGIAGLLVGGAAMAAIDSSADAAEERAEVQAAKEAAADEAVAEEAAVEARQAVLTDAVDACNLEGASGFELADGNTTLTFDMRGDDELTGASYTDISCIFAGLAMPSSVSSHIDQTTSMDGRQTETWGDLTASWSYHPDRGLDGVLTLAND